MHVLACRKRGLKLVRGRAVGTGPQNGCRIASLNCHGQSLEEVHERALLIGGLPNAVAKVPKELQGQWCPKCLGWWHPKPDAFRFSKGRL